MIESLVERVKLIKSRLPGLKDELLKRGDAPEFSLLTLPQFNRKVWGLKVGLTVLAARTSQGKSSMALQWAWDLADQNKRTLFISLEMTVESLLERLFCNLMEVDNFSLLTGKLKTEQALQDRWELFEKMVSKVPLLITCGVGQTFNELNTLVELLDPKPQSVFIDYIQAVRAERNEREQMNEYIRKFRELCLKYRMVGVLCSQINRAVEKENDYMPSLENLKSTGVLEEHSDSVFLLHWPSFYDYNKPDTEHSDKNEYKIFVAKQRNGRTGEYTLYYRPEFYRFYEVPTDEKTDKVREIFGGEVIRGGKNE